MVGHIPLEDGIGVRVPDPQQKCEAAFAAGSEVWETSRQGLESRSATARGGVAQISRGEIGEIVTVTISTPLLNK